MNYIYWDPSRAIFPYNLPILGRPLLWYGFFFALGFFLAYWTLRYLLRQEKVFCDKLTGYVILGTVIGARLGDVLFYQSWHDLYRDPLLIFKVWEGGLASHGAVAGIFLSLLLFAKRYKMRFWHLVDLLVIPASIAACLIRIGNFFNQEILGTLTTLPWAVVFGHPADGTYPAPRHPVQLYEALFYLATFFFLFFLPQRKKWPDGKLAGLFFLLVFTFRFFIEFLKVEQSAYLPHDSFLRMGQLLSIPFILLSLYLLKRRKATR